MKKILVLTIVGFWVLNSFSQELSTLKNKTIKIQLDGKGIHAKALEYAIINNWKFSKYEFVSKKDIKANYNENDDILMLGLIDGYITRQDDGRVYDVKSTYLAIVNKYVDKKYYDIKGKKVVDYIQISDHTISSTDSIDVYSDIVFHVQQLNNYLIAKEEKANKIRSMPYYYNKYINNLSVSAYKKKKILINKHRLDPKFKKSDISKSYTLKYSIVEKEIIDNAIINNEDVLYYKHWYNSHCLISAKTGEVIHCYTALLKGAKKCQEELFKEYGKRLK